MPARGTGQFGPDVIVGSSEYQKKMREKNPLTHKLAQARYRLKQKQLVLATKIAAADGISTEQALAEVTAKTDAIVALRSEMVHEGRVDHHAGTPVEVVDDGMPPVSEMAKEAEERGIPYAQVVQEWRDIKDKWSKPVEVDDDFLSIVAKKVGRDEREGDDDNSGDSTSEVGQIGGSDPS